MRARLAAGAALVSLAVAACATHRRPSTRPEEVHPPRGLVVEGIASWYGPGYDGKRTSNGEVFDQDALTAAHYNWAFGTQVRVTLLSSGRTVVVRINDRFPPWKGRLLDLSRGAARTIGLIGPGTGQVRVEVIE
jgi:peptidoglycan lytic transglycosylase